MRAKSFLHLCQHFCNFKRMNNVRLARGAHLAFVMLHAELPRLSDQGDIFINSVSLNATEERLKALIDLI